MSCRAAARFVTKAELGKLGLGHLVGTPLLRAYLHGYFLHNRLHAKARALAEPFAYEAYRAQRVAAKLDAERQSRIGLVRKLPKVPARPALPCLLTWSFCISLSPAVTAHPSWHECNKHHTASRDKEYCSFREGLLMQDSIWRFAYSWGAWSVGSCSCEC